VSHNARTSTTWSAIAAEVGYRFPMFFWLLRRLHQLLSGFIDFICADELLSLHLPRD